MSVVAFAGRSPSLPTPAEEIWTAVDDRISGSVIQRITCLVRGHRPMHDVWVTAPREHGPTDRCSCCGGEIRLHVSRLC
jgi:hypothetical protein